MRKLSDVLELQPEEFFFSQLSIDNVFNCRLSNSSNDKLTGFNRILTETKSQSNKVPQMSRDSGGRIIPIEGKIRLPVGQNRKLSITTEPGSKNKKRLRDMSYDMDYEPISAKRHKTIKLNCYKSDEGGYETRQSKKRTNALLLYQEGKTIPPQTPQPLTNTFVHEGDRAQTLVETDEAIQTSRKSTGSPEKLTEKPHTHAQHKGVIENNGDFTKQSGSARDKNSQHDIDIRKKKVTFAESKDSAMSSQSGEMVLTSVLLIYFFYKMNNLFKKVLLIVLVQLLFPPRHR